MRRFTLLAATACALAASSQAQAREPAWPDLSKPAARIGGGEHDAAVIVGIENYDFVPSVDNAETNADQWYDYLARTRSVPPENITLLTGNDATREEILGATRKASGRVGTSGTLWFVFIGHGATSIDAKEGLLVAVDAQQKPESLEDRSVRRDEILAALGASRAKAIRVVLDACFSGRGRDGKALVRGLQPLTNLILAKPEDPRIAIFTAAQRDQFAGPLPGTDTPAFSYLVLGGLRGWAAEPDGTITAGDLWRYSTRVLDATVHGRDQTPDFMGPPDAFIALSAGEKAPDLVELAKATAGLGPETIQTRAPKREKGVKLWISGGASAMPSISGGTRPLGWHAQLTARDIIPSWELGLDAGGLYRREDVRYDPSTNQTGEKDVFGTYYARLKADYLAAIPGKKDLVFAPDFFAFGAAAGFYLVKADYINFSYPFSQVIRTETKSTHLVVVPVLEAGPIWKLGSRWELRLLGQYAVPTARAIGFKPLRISGPGMTADLSYRFK